MPFETGLLPQTVTAPRTDPVYNCHAYLTKVPIGAIVPFIETLSEPGEMVVDFFAGSGMTGLAARSLGRRAALSDISVLGQHICSGYLAEVAADTLRETGARVIGQARDALDSLYLTRRQSDGAEVELVRTVWSFTYICPACAEPMVYFKHVSPEGAPPKHCPSCQGAFERRRWTRGKDVPVEVVVDGPSGKQVAQPISAIDETRIARATADDRLAQVPSQSIDSSREMYGRSGLGKAGLTRTADFFSPRNAIALLELWRAIENVEDTALQKKLRFAFTAILPRASRRYQWSAKRPLNAQNQTYYIAPVYYEWNVFELFERKVEAAVRADAELASRAGEPRQGATTKPVTYDLASADKLAHLEDSSVDYVFTDPPFGSNIFYSDMSLFHEAWLGRTTANGSEAVVHTSGSRKAGSADRYEMLLRDAFSEAFRILKPGRFMSVVFGNSNGRIWGLVQRALRDAGFAAAPAHVAILDKGQRSVKGLNSGSENVVTVDLIITVQKPDGAAETAVASPLQADTSQLIREAVAGLTTKSLPNPSHLYADILRRAIERHLTLDQLHLSDVLIALRQAGYGIDRKTGLLQKQEAPQRAAA
jgi:16S rRNA G966 N2-methylase RsmD